MNENEDIEVTITNPDMEVSNAEHAHSTLSTIREHNNPVSPQLSFGNDHPRYIKNSKSLRSDEFYHISDKKEHSSEPFDIDLLLRYYACNSSMEKSINKMFETKVDKNCLHDPHSSQVCKDTDRGPLIELGAVNRVFNLLHRESFENVSSLTFPFRDTIIKLQSLLSRYNSNELQQILSSDSSMKVCQHCGVISCSKSRSKSVESRQSPPRTSYFLNTQIFSNDNTDSKAHRTIEKFYNTKKQQKRFGKCSDSQKSSTCKRYDDNKKNSKSTDSTDKPDGKVSGNTAQRVEIMIAERENGVETEKTRIVQSVVSEQVSEESKTANKKDLQSCINVFQAAEPLFVKGEKISLPKCSDKASEIEKIQKEESNKNCMKTIAVAVDPKASQNTKPVNLAMPNDVLSFVDNNLLRRKQIRQKSPIGSQSSMNKTNEKVLKDIFFEKSKADGSEIPQLKSMQDVMNNCNIDSIIDTMAYLAGGRFDSTYKKQDEFVVQFNDRSWVQSRNSNNRRCFILHAGRDGDPQLDTAFNMYGESKHPDRTTSKNKFGNAKNTLRSSEQSASLTCVMEDDSLENCTKANLRVDSDHSGSSSSAENMIREWMSCSQKEDRSGVNSRDITVSSSPVIIGLDVNLQTPGINDKCVCCTETSIDMQRDPEVKHSNEKRDSFLSSNDRSRTHTSGENSKVGNSKESVSSDAKKKKCEQVDSSGTKKFGIKRFLESLKSIKSWRSMKYKQSKSSTSSNKNFLHSSVSRKVARRINYNESSLKSLIDNNRGHGEVANTLTLYRKILEDTKEMDWDSFRRFIGKLHASQKELWHDICDAIDNEAKRLADKGDGVTEVCIEISSVPGKGTKHAERSCSNEIVFEMDMTLRDVEGFLDSELASAEKRQLDTLWRASEVIRVRNDDVCNTEVASNQAE
ncbi:uncharacterized protein LOC143216434 [Lasioglossum baleicum]|uniref:uncharacterized protein LOC143216434 n=1 Tax=Lasioglossum baleicum TaxID=434251 RepID=UPI003FCCB11E